MPVSAKIDRVGTRVFGSAGYCSKGLCFAERDLGERRIFPPPAAFSLRIGWTNDRHL